jgi:hypothetical protein
VSNLNAERETIAGKLAAAGVSSVTLDPAMSAPFVLVGPPRSNGAGAGIGGWAVRYPVIVAATPPGDAAALAWQLDQVELILRTLGPSDDWTPGTYDPAGKNLPAYTITYPRDVPNPDC